MRNYQVHDTIGPYRVRRMLPRGGMAQAMIVAPLPGYTGPPEVVVKVADSDHNDQIKFEIDQMVHLQHPHIVQLLPIARAKEQSDSRARPVYIMRTEAYNPLSPYFIVMEYLRGGSLENLLRQSQRLAPSVAVLIIRQIGHALAYLHTAGVVHHDIKPGNMLLRQPITRWQARVPDVVLADFGVAEPVGGRRFADAQGTTGYTAPEHAFGDPAHPRHDVFALGAVLYRLLIGRLPFVETVIPGTPLPQAIYPRVLLPSISPQLEAVVLNSIATDYTERYRSVATLLNDLEQTPEAHQPAHLRRALLPSIGTAPVLMTTTTFGLMTYRVVAALGETP